MATITKKSMETMNEDSNNDLLANYKESCHDLPYIWCSI